MAAADTSASSNNRADPAGTPRTEWVPIGVLRPNPRNARTHSRKQIKQIAASIKKFGFLNSVLVDDADMVLAGHGRLEAAKLENLTHVPVIRFDHLTEAQKRAYVIADNKLAEQAGWDREILARRADRPYAGRGLQSRIPQMKHKSVGRTRRVKRTMGFSGFQPP
jgi:ParB-like chromosome segregation protein Spo0J